MIHTVHNTAARRALALFCLVVVLLSGVALDAGAIGRQPHEHPAYADAGAHLFNGELTSIHVSMDPADLAALLADPWSDQYKPCSVHLFNSVMDEVHSNVAIRVRGNTSRGAIKKSWKLSFNTYVPGRKIHGLEKLHVNGNHNDPSIIRHKLASDLYNQMGVPSSRAQHVRLKINDGALVEGVYILVEHIDEQFVDAWFDNDDGSLYEGAHRNGDPADLGYVSPGAPVTYMELGDGETYREKLHENPDFFDLVDFIAFVNHAGDPIFAAEINQLFNVDSFLRVLAVDAAIGNWDAFWWGKNNFYLYHDTDTGRFEYIP